ncbi:MAG: amidohydrolase family protein [Planctomycetes bacterium]|nr:amidohydrolase family protein [Planctomycetota bacterium]
MKLDSHVHFWRYSPRTHPWIGPGMERLRRDHLPLQLAPLLKQHGFDGCIAVQSAETAAETEFLLDLAARHEFIRGVVGWVDLAARDLSAVLERLSTRPKWTGVRHFAHDERDEGFLVRPDIERGIAQLARYDVTFELLVREREMPAAIELVSRHPSQRFVLDHLGKPRIAAGAREPWATLVRSLARRPNVTAKVSGLVTEADWKHWRRDDFAFYIDTALEAFGPRRLTFGSDWPVCTLAADYATLLTLYRERA